VFAAAAAGLPRSAATDAKEADPTRPTTSPSLGPLKQVEPRFAPARSRASRYFRPPDTSRDSPVMYFESDDAR
jgi:hypothetical protein